jgi:capsular exopolysaccharide synthesis family protein
VAPPAHGAGAHVGNGQSPAGTVNIPRLIHRALRGRYTAAILLGIVFGGAAGAAAWRLGHPIYESQGLIRIANALPVVVTRNDINDPMPMLMFDTFLQSQKLLIGSRRMVDAAIQDPVWKAMGKTVPQPPDQFFATSMKVESRSRSEIIQVSVDDKDPGTAAAAVTSIVNAYSEYYNSEEKRTERERNSVLFENRDKQQKDIERFAALVQSGVEKFGGAAPEAACTLASEHVSEMQSRLNELRVSLAAAMRSAAASDAKHPGGATARAEQATGPDLSADELAMTDPGMRGLLDQQLQAEQNLRGLSQRGYGSAHPQVVAAKEALDNIKERVARQAAISNEMHRRALAAGMVSGGTDAGSPRPFVGRSVDELKAAEAMMVKQVDEARRQVDAMASARLELERNQENLRLAKEELSKTSDRIESLRTEGALGGRLTVLSSGDVPISPARDTRPRFAAAAALGGFCLPAAFFVLLSLVRRRYRYADDTESDATSTSVPLLGIVPEVSKRGRGEEITSVASHCVHQIRVSLNAAAAHRPGPRAYLITSAAAGEGKTTLTTSLALSFAAARARTLIIDADLVGRKLTSAFRANEYEGLHEAIEAGTIRQRIRRTDSGLYILTAGRGGAADACAMPRAAIRAVIEQARSYFDVILLDSGPIMGSIEASMIAPEVDGVIFAISRGQSRQAADAAMQRLRRIGANVVGCVFNRAKSTDLIASAYGSSSRMSLPAPNQTPAAAARDAFIAEEFGPVVQAVAAAMPAASAN